MIAPASPLSDSSDTIFSRDQFLAKHIIKTSIIMFVLLSALRWAFFFFEEQLDNGETYEMIENFINMVEKLKDTPKNKFRKVAEKDLESIIEEIETICQIKEFKLNDYSLYLVNESFKKNDK